MHIHKNNFRNKHWLMPLILAALTTAHQCLAAIEVNTERVESIQITATRVPQLAGLIPASITIIRGDELSARGAIDLATALGLVAGVEAPMGGDTGPAGAVPSFWGLHEFDAFLLVVDGVPWGGAFNPAIPTLNLNNVERIEVLKGAAPVLFGATSFVGVIHVIHYPAGKSAEAAEIAIGNHSSQRISATKALYSIGNFQQSISIDGQKLGFSDSREAIKSGNLLYRGAGTAGNGTWRFDANIGLQRQTPPSPTVRQGETLTAITPRDANYNPADAHLDENRYQLVLGYSRPAIGGLWDSTLSWSRAQTNDVRGFLRAGLVDDGSPNADSQRKNRRTRDLFFDTHLSQTMGHFSLLLGADFLTGLGTQTSQNGEYYAPLSGTVLPPKTTDLHVDEINTIDDARYFYGQYAQLQWMPDARWLLLGGVRLNETRERKTSAHIDGFDSTQNESAVSKQSTTRLGGMLGVSYRAWQQGANETVLYTDYRNTFKPAAIDFGPDYTPGVLKPETAASVEAGVKGALLDGQFSYDISAFLLRFKNLVLRTTDANGGPILQNAGGERLQGAELQSRYRINSHLSLAANLSYHDAKFTEGIATEGGENLNLSGHHLTLSPRWLATTGVVYSPPQGWQGSATLAYVGRRFLDLENKASAGSYTKMDATIGYRFGDYRLVLNGYNLGNKRPPVTQSEFGDSSYYLLAGRRLLISLRAAL